MKSPAKTIWTIGHSTHTIEKFIAMLQSHKIQMVTDIRRFPGSARYPHFNKELLQVSLNSSGIDYLHLPELGGRRKPKEDSIHTQWRNSSFRGYADYMDTEEFKTAINRLEQLAFKQSTAYMCSEAVWWRCHRALVSDHLKELGWHVMHIMGTNKSEEHPYTSVYREEQGKLFE